MIKDLSRTFPFPFPFGPLVPSLSFSDDSIGGPSLILGIGRGTSTTGATFALPFARVFTLSGGLGVLTSGSLSALESRFCSPSSEDCSKYRATRAFHGV